MTTSSWSSSPDHQTDAGFRAWVADFIAHCTTVGLTQTADTGQINTATVTRPGTNTDGGYAIFHDNDALHGTAPYYIRFDFGTGAVATRLRVKMTVGTSSNGTGTIGGTALTAAQIVSASTGTSTGSAFTSYMCKTDFGFWFVFSAGSPVAGFGNAAAGVLRTSDNTGAATATGATFIFNNNSTAVSTAGGNQQLRFASAAAVFAVSTGNTPSFIFIPSPPSVGGTLVGADVQLFPALHWTPQATPCIGACGAKITEVAEAATLSATLFGSTAHTYINMGGEFGTHITGPATQSQYGMCLIWE